MRRCERCGVMLAAGQSGQLCPGCQGMQAGDTDEERVWRVKKPDGVLLGPLTQEEVHLKFQQEEITAADQLARGEGGFRLISSYPEFSKYFRRPGEKLELTLKQAPPRRWPAVVAMVGVLLLLAAGLLVWRLWFARPDTEVGTGDIMAEVLEIFASAVPNPQGQVPELLEKARQLHLRDDRLSYLRADKLLMAAVQLEPTNLEACCLWVKNRALLDTLAPDALMRKVALDLLDHLQQEGNRDPCLPLARGWLELITGKATAARQHAQRLLADEPDNPDLLLLEAASLLDSSTELAVKKLDKVLKAAPRHRLAERLLATAYQRLGRFNGALRLLKQRMSRDPSQADIMEQIGRLYLEVGRHRQALESFETVLAAEPKNISAALTMARISYQLLGKPRRCLRLLQGLLDEKPALNQVELARLHAELAVCWRIAGQVNKSRVAAERALQLDPTNVSAAMAMAVVRQMQGQVSQALQGYLDLRAHLPGSAHLMARIGSSWAQVPDMRKASEAIRRAVELSPREPALALLAAAFFLSIDDTDQAYAWLQRVTDLNLLWRRQHRVVREVYDDDTLLLDAARLVRGTAVKYDQDPLLLSLIGLVLIEANSQEEGRALLYKALEADPGCFQANLFLGWLNFRKGQWQRALGFLGEARKQRRGHLATSVLHGYTLLNLRQHRAAAEVFRQVLRRDAANLAAKAGLAATLAAGKRRRQARKLLLEVLRNDGDNVFVKSLLFELGT